MSDRCSNPVPLTDATCGDYCGALRRYCSAECAQRCGNAELAELGITLEMMKEALNGYYECKRMIEEKSND